VRRGGFRYQVAGSDWAALAEQYATAPQPVAPVRDVVQSIVRSPARHQLLFTTSMWDLVVTATPMSSPPVDVVIVRSAVGMRDTADGRVLVEHLPIVGHADAIERDASEAVPLFWRFMAEKYGIEPG
jgi:hypothetical protein